LFLIKKNTGTHLMKPRVLGLNPLRSGEGECAIKLSEAETRNAARRRRLGSPRNREKTNGYYWSAKERGFGSYRRSGNGRAAC